MATQCITNYKQNLSHRIFQASYKLQAFYNLLVEETLEHDDFTLKTTKKDSVSSFIENRKDVLEIGQMFKNKSNFFSCYLFITSLETVISWALMYYLISVGIPVVLSVSNININSFTVF